MERHKAEINREDRRWSVTVNGKKLVGKITKDHAVALRNEYVGSGACRLAEVRHPELVRDLLGKIDVIAYLGIRDGLVAVMAAANNLWLIDEFVEHYPEVPRTALEENMRQREPLLNRFLGKNRKGMRVGSTW